MARSRRAIAVEPSRESNNRSRSLSANPLGRPESLHWAMVGTASSSCWAVEIPSRRRNRKSHRREVAVALTVRGLYFVARAVMNS